MLAGVYPFGEALRATLTTRLAAFERHQGRPGQLRRAAVAVAVVEGGDGHAAFVLTARAAGLRAHARQWALPGGRLDEGETPEVAVRRELHEEVGLRAEAGDVLGLLDDYPTRSGYLMTPVVVWCGDSAGLAANPAEVAAVHRVPLRDLDHPSSPRFLAIPESSQPVIQLHANDVWLHAPTAAVLYQFRQVALRGEATRVAHLEQPVWAWR